MRFAETQGDAFDFVLRMAAGAMISQTEEQVGAFSQAVATAIVEQGRAYRGTKFHSLSGEEITQYLVA